MKKLLTLVLALAMRFHDMILYTLRPRPSNMAGKKSP